MRRTTRLTRVIEYSLTRDDVLSAFTALAALSPKGKLPGAGIYGGPKQQVRFSVKSGMFLAGPRRVWADDEGLHERLDGVEQVYRWPAVEPVIDLGDFLAVPLAGLGADVPAFSAFALLIPRGTPGLAELRTELDARAVAAAGDALPMPGEDKGPDVLAELEDDVLPDDYQAVNRAALRSRVGRRQLLVLIAWSLPIGAVVGLCLTLIPSFALTPAVAALVGALSGTLGLLVVVLAMIPTQVRNMVASGVYKVGSGAWWCDQERFYEEIGGRQYVIDWAKIDRIQRADGIAIVWIGEAFTILVPCRDDRGRAFVAAAEGHVAR